MTKQMIKKLYTFYSVKGEYDEIKNNNPEHVISCYTAGVAHCVKYHDTLIDWVNEIVANKYKNGFGLKVLTEDGEDKVEIHRYNLECNKWTCDSKLENDVIKAMANIITYYLDDDLYYYEIEDDGIYIHMEHTGHQYYRSPYESCDSCGTCDGARCDVCRTRYIVSDLYLDKEYYNGFDKEEAERIRDEMKKDYSDIIADILSRHIIDMEWFEKEIAGASDYKALLKILSKYKIPYVTTR